MRRLVARLAPIPVLLALAVSMVPPAAARPGGDSEEILETFRPRFLRVQDANALLRGVLDLRRSSVDERSQTITVRAPREVLRELRGLLEEWDRPPAHWHGRLLAITSTREVELASLELEAERASLVFEGGHGDRLQLALEARDVRERSLVAAYECTTRLDMPSGVPSFLRKGSGELSLGGNGELSLVRAPTDAQRQELAKLLGVERPVQEVVLRLAPAR